jgi:hypothetical protein
VFLPFAEYSVEKDGRVLDRHTLSKGKRDAKLAMFIGSEMTNPFESRKQSP